MLLTMDVLLYQFNRENVIRQDFSLFLRLYDPARIGSGKPLKRLMGRLEFAIGGYDDDPREVYEIPEVRRFYAALHRAWPYSLYFCHLQGIGLVTMAACCIDTLTLIRHDDHDLRGVSFGVELVYWIRDGFEPMNRLWLRAGLPEGENVARTQAIFDYFKLS
ncbi:MAG: hypothetical protein AB1705_16430 [Verrucomicrobiota bacterium]